MGLGQFGVEFQGRSAFDQGLVVPPVLQQHLGQIVVGLHVLRVLLDCDLKLANRLFRLV